MARAAKTSKLAPPDTIPTHSMSIAGWLTPQELQALFLKPEQQQEEELLGHLASIVGEWVERQTKEAAATIEREKLAEQIGSWMRAYCHLALIGDGQRARDGGQGGEEREDAPSLPSVLSGIQRAIGRLCSKINEEAVASVSAGGPCCELIEEMLRSLEPASGGAADHLREGLRQLRESISQ